MISRRFLLAGAASFLAAPALLRVTTPMRISSWHELLMEADPTLGFGIVPVAGFVGDPGLGKDRFGRGLYWAWEPIKAGDPVRVRTNTNPFTGPWLVNAKASFVPDRRIAARSSLTRADVRNIRAKSRPNTNHPS